jgi:hypothetical protein
VIAPSGATSEPDQIIWIGKFLPVYPMFWRYSLVIWAIVTLPVSLTLVLRHFWFGVLIINGVVAIILGTAYLLAFWLSHRPQGGPNCLFAVTLKGAHYHAGDELRYYGQPWAGDGTASTTPPRQLPESDGIANSNDLFIPWEQVRTVEIRPSLGLLYISRGLRGPIPLFCTADNFDAVCRYVLTHAPHARLKGVRPQVMASTPAANK